MRGLRRRRRPRVLRRENAHGDVGSDRQHGELEKDLPGKEGPTELAPRREGIQAGGSEIGFDGAGDIRPSDFNDAEDGDDDLRRRRLRAVPVDSGILEGDILRVTVPQVLKCGTGVEEKGAVADTLDGAERRLREDNEVQRAPIVVRVRVIAGKASTHRSGGRVLIFHKSCGRQQSYGRVIRTSDRDGNRLRRAIGGQHWLLSEERRVLGVGERQAAPEQPAGAAEGDRPAKSS